MSKSKAEAELDYLIPLAKTLLNTDPANINEIMAAGGRAGGHSRSAVENVMATLRLPEEMPSSGVQQTIQESRKKRLVGPRVAVSTDDPGFKYENREALRQAIHKWITTKPFVLQQPHRAAHKGLSAMKLTLSRYRGEEKIESKDLDYHSLQVVMVEHDWSKLFSGAKIENDNGAGGEWHLPYENQVFEFAISGACVLALCHGAADVTPSLTIGVRAPGRQEWFCDNAAAAFDHRGWHFVAGQKLIDAGLPDVNEGFERLYDFLYEQIRAVCIMLEAEVAESAPVRAPYKTNAPPKDKAPLPALSHHVVRLNRNPRPAPLPAADRQPGTSRRLHFRRGHWRHYATHKTWIKWMLVGNPDLGFVDKAYRV